MRAHRRKLIAGLVVLAGIVGLVIGAVFLNNRRLPLEDIARVERLGGRVTMQAVYTPRVRWLPNRMLGMNLPFNHRWVPLVELDGTGVTDADLSLLEPLAPDLVSLNRTQISNEGVRALAGFQNLHCIRLDSTPVTDAGLAHLQRLARLRMLSLNNTEITDEGVKQLVGLQNLRGLHLDSTPVTDACLGHLKQLPLLSVLSLRNTGITDAGVKELATLPNLFSLNLDGTAVTDGCLEHLKRFSQLSGLTLYETALTGKAVDAFRAARPNARVEYSLRGQR